MPTGSQVIAYSQVLRRNISSYPIGAQPDSPVYRTPLYYVSFHPLANQPQDPSPQPRGASLNSSYQRPQPCLIMPQSSNARPKLPQFLIAFSCPCSIAASFLLISNPSLSVCDTDFMFVDRNQVPLAIFWTRSKFHFGITSVSEVMTAVSKQKRKPSGGP